MSTTDPAHSPDMADTSFDAASRRDRAAIAAQACETCRSRKSKCDERRPKCTLCTRLNVECVYRVPQPTKKDKTLVHILQAIERVETKIDRISSPALRALEANSSRAPFDTSEYSSTRATSTTREQTEQDDRNAERSNQGNFLPSDPMVANSHLTASHRVLVWPAIYLMLINAQAPRAEELQGIGYAGSTWFTRFDLQAHSPSLPHTPNSPFSTADAMNMTTGIAGMTNDQMRQLADAYFETFNVVHPILDRASFFTDVINAINRGVHETGDRNTNICLALSVFALGQVALEGSLGPPTVPVNSGRSGVRGGDLEHPPGLALFNEARRRFGYSMNLCNLENVQIYLLHAMYYESCARHMDFWRSCGNASIAFQTFLRCEGSIDWNTPRGDMIERVYWICLLAEDTFHLEIDLPPTGIYSIEDQIPLPSFQRSEGTNGADANDSDHLRYHFLAMIGLRRVLSRIHLTLHLDSGMKVEGSHSEYDPPAQVIKELARQLESWRTLLPSSLQWSDSDPHANVYSSNHSSRGQAVPLFTVEDTGNSVSYRQNLDVVMAHLRTRFYYGRYLIYRPYIFKALHFPENMTEEDASFCALALQSILLWPITMSPCRNKKRLLPYNFLWTQNIIGVLLIFRQATENECLRQICNTRVNMNDMNTTIRLLIDWIRDMKTIDATADWAWGFIEHIFQGLL